MDSAFRDEKNSPSAAPPVPRRSEGLARELFGSRSALTPEEGSFSSPSGRMTAKEAAGIALQRRTARVAAQRAGGGAVSRGVEGAPAPNRTGLPDSLKAGIEGLSGLPMDDVRVHYNSPAPAQLQALAYTQGSEIHVAPGQERHLPHEAWHVAQQKQGRVRATTQLKGLGINDEPALEAEADAMGARAARREAVWPRASVAWGHAGSASEEMGRAEGSRLNLLSTDDSADTPGQSSVSAYAQGTDVSGAPAQKQELPQDARHIGGRRTSPASFAAGSIVSPIQRKPQGPFVNATPTNDGIHWDTETSTTHNKETVPSEVIAVMRNPPDGKSPSVDPPGWAWLKKKFGKLKGEWVRFHIINAKLGGPGNNPLNLVPTTHVLNHNPGWRSLEEAAKSSASKNVWTYVDVSLTYDNTYPGGIPKTIQAEQGEWSNNTWTAVGNPVTLQQDDPNVVAGGDYLPATQITQGILQDWGIPANLVAVAKALIDGTYKDQDAFDEAWSEADLDEYDGAFRRMYVDEDDNIAGPYPVIVKAA
ncbi:eCIS core domain-containing protein [Sorangium sp. So ce117]|uniref:eCIS core domain-containing protein n=1 Tax=Sorangium sp. So ce117 TaxID=3133277 RepID=UPI003F5E9F16